jgi:hypothetical protein
MSPSRAASASTRAGSDAPGDRDHGPATRPTIVVAIVAAPAFPRPGIGLRLVRAIDSADRRATAAYLCMIALVIAFINPVVDLRYYAVDSRLRIGRDADR